MSRNFDGDARKSLISWSSSTASSRPATSAKVVLGWSFETALARDLPKLMTRLPPPCIWLMKKIASPMMRRNGMIPARNDSQGFAFWESTSNFATSALRISLVISSVYCSGNRTSYLVPLSSVPFTTWSRS